MLFLKIHAKVHKKMILNIFIEKSFLYFCN